MVNQFIRNGEQSARAMRDPRMRAYLQRAGHVSAAILERMRATVRAEVAQLEAARLGRLLHHIARQVK